MPKASIDEHRDPWPQEDDVWPTSTLRQHSSMLSVPEAAPEESTAKLQLENAFLAAVRNH